MKEKDGRTQSEIAESADVNANTIGKYFSGIEDDSANFEIVRKLVASMGGSLDELAGIGTSAERDLDAYQMVVAGLEARLDEKDERISARWKLAEKERERAESEIAYERRRAKVATILSYAVLGLFVMMFLLDYLLPTVGWIRR